MSIVFKEQFRTLAQGHKYVKDLIDGGVKKKSPPPEFIILPILKVNNSQSLFDFELKM